MLLSSSVGLGLLEVKTFPSPLTDYNCKTTVLNDRPPPLVTGGTKFHNTFIEDFATIFSFQVLFNLFKRSFIFFYLTLQLLLPLLPHLQQLHTLFWH